MKDGYTVVPATVVANNVNGASPAVVVLISTNVLLTKHATVPGVVSSAAGDAVVSNGYNVVGLIM